MTTARQLILDALRLSTVIGQYEDPTANEYQQALRMLNDLMGKWALKGLSGYRRTQEVLSLTASQASYTIGSGANFNTVQPVRIVSALLRDSGGYDRPLNVISDTEFDRKFADKDITGEPTHISFTKGESTGKIAIYPAAQGSGYSLVLRSVKPISTTLTLDDTIDLPAGWNHLLKYNMAVLLCPLYGKEAPAQVLGEFADSQATVQIDNLRKMDLSTPPLEGHGGGFNVNSREFTP